MIIKDSNWNHWYFSEYPRLWFYPKDTTLEDIEKRVQSLYQYIHGHLPCSDLILEILEKQSITVEIYIKGAPKDMRSSADCRGDERNHRIRLHVGVQNDFEIFSDFIYELHNAVNPFLSEYTQVPNISSRKRPSMRDVEVWETFIGKFADETDYALKLENAEYYSYLFHYRMMKRGLKNAAWLDGSGTPIETPSEFSADLPQTWEEYWTDVNQPSNEYNGYSHAETYTHQFLDMQLLYVNLKLQFTQQRIEELEKDRQVLRASISWAGNAALVLRATQAIDELQQEYSSLTSDRHSLYKKRTTVVEKALAESLRFEKQSKMVRKDDTETDLKLKLEEVRVAVEESAVVFDKSKNLMPKANSVSEEKPNGFLPYSDLQKSPTAKSTKKSQLLTEFISYS